MTKQELIDYIVQKGKENTLVLNTIEGLVEVAIDKFVEQPADGMLYDLNRDSATVLTFIDDEKWVNDYAVGLVIKKLWSLI